MDYSLIYEAFISLWSAARKMNFFLFMNSQMQIRQVIQWPDDLFPERLPNHCVARSKLIVVLFSKEIEHKAKTLVLKNAHC